MKYLLSIFAVLALVGAGCVTTPDPAETDADSEAVVEDTIEKDDDDAAKDGEEEAEDGEEEAADSQDATESAEAESADVEEVVVEAEVETEDDTPNEVTQIVDEQDPDDDGVVEIILDTSADVSVDMESGNFFFAPSSMTAGPGDTINLTFTANSGFHTFVIDEIGLKFTVAAGETFSFTAPTEAGSYAFYCDVGSHRAFGMEGTLVIQ